MGWFDGNPCNLYPLPPDEVAVQYVSYMGGVPKILERANIDFQAGSYRWVAEVLKHIVALPIKDQQSLNQDDLKNTYLLLADALEQLGYQSEAGTWRNFFLMGSQELRVGIYSPDTTSSSASSFIAALNTELCFDSIAVSLVGHRAEKLKAPLVIFWVFTDTKEQVKVTVENAALSYLPVTNDQLPSDVKQCAVTTRDTLNQLLCKTVLLPDAFQKNQIVCNDDVKTSIATFFKLLGKSDPNFPIVTPKRSKPKKQDK